MTFRRLALIASAAALASTACGFLGYNNRVLQRVPSPDGRMIAVCQEIPEFDGPGYDIRLERPDGGLIRHLEKRGEARGCDELVWSPSGRLLAVMKGGQAQVTFIDVRFALDNPSNDAHHLHRAGRLHLLTLGVREGDDGSDTTAW